jgi:5,10-methylene-tetrahydrofolate dehydrogenase/methenyl tetrahydrofolate cyclohydrolase
LHQEFRENEFEEEEEEEEESQDGFDMISLKPEDFVSGLTISEIIERAERNNEIRHMKGTLIEIPIPEDIKETLTIKEISELHDKK